MSSAKSKLQGLVMVTTMMSTFNDTQRVPRIVPKCARAGKKKKCKYSGGCDGYKSHCKYKIIERR